jgi:hypothetical protein
VNDEMNIKTGKPLAAYSLGLGALYLVFGLLELARGLSETFAFEWALMDVSTALVYPDIFSGVTLSIIGLIFLFGVAPQWKAKTDSGSYLAVGTLLAGVFFAVYLAIMAAHAIGWGVYNVVPVDYVDIFADWAEWTWIADMRAGIWLFAFALPAAYYTVNVWLGRKRNQ